MWPFCYQQYICPITQIFSDEQLSAVIINSKLDLIYTDKTNFDRIKKLFDKTLLFLKTVKILL